MGHHQFQRVKVLVNWHTITRTLLVFTSKAKFHTVSSIPEYKLQYGGTEPSKFLDLPHSPKEVPR